MTAINKLPDAEFEIMKIVWQLSPPVTSSMLMELLTKEGGKAWKLQTIHTLLGRLVERGFLKTRKSGKERFFEPLIGRDEYLQYETQSFVKQYYGGSRLNLINAMYQNGSLKDDEIDELIQWMNDQRKKQ
ncbi:MAG: BlaI/MecI/CopY family transcriptional regulator [Eubacteriales bacterium]|nr:BlaI/MecI/CopY family transcriptional regulator [Eubacteriales bacterium]